MFGEIHQSTADDMHQATIGVMAHEFGHTINWPDLYDTDGSSNGGVGTWSLMAAGELEFNVTTCRGFTRACGCLAQVVPGLADPD